MQTLSETILTSIVENPDDVSVTATEDEYGFVNITAKVNPEDMGRVIGKNGRIISAIRRILKIKAIKTEKRFRFDLIDPQNPSIENPPLPEEPESLS